MLPDAARKDQNIQPSKGDREGCDMLRDAEDEQIHGFSRRRVVAGEQGTYVSRLARDSQQAALMVKQVLELIQGQPARPHQMQQDTRVDAAGSRGHHHPIQSTEAHGRVDAAPVSHGTQAGAATQMCSNHARGG